MLVVIVKHNDRTDSRASMVRGAVSLIRTRGVNATSFSDVLASGGTAGCVVAGVAIDTVAADRPMIDLVRATFRSWVDLLTEQLATVGVPGRRASRVAVAVVAGMEGALILCRAEGSSAPLETVATELKRLLPPEV